METGYTNALIILEPHIVEALADRHGALKPGTTPRGATNRTRVVNRDLGRYYDLLAAARRDLRGRFSDEEQRQIVVALQSTHTQTWALGMLAVEVEDSLADTDDGAMDATHDPLVAKLRALTPTEELAIIDAIERGHVHGNAAMPVL